MLLNCGVEEDSWESLGLQGDPTNPSWRKSVLSIHWKDWCWSWNSNTLATWCKELTHWKRAWCWERLKAGGEGDNRGWDGWMASLTQWTLIWASSWGWWWTGKPGVLQSMGLQRAGHDLATEQHQKHEGVTNHQVENKVSICALQHTKFLEDSCKLGSYKIIPFSLLHVWCFYWDSIPENPFDHLNIMVTFSI